MPAHDPHNPPTPYSDTDIKTGPDAEVLTLAHRRWFGLALVTLSITIGALAFSLGFPQPGPERSAQVIGRIFLGPFSQPAWFPWFRPIPNTILPWTSLLLLLTHPLHPRPLTVLTTFLGGALWSLMGWYTIAAT